MNAGDDVADAAIEALARAAGAENPALGETVQRAVRRERSQRVPTKAKLEKKYRGENLPDNPDRHFFPDTVKYLTAEEREAQRIVVDGSGNLVWAKDGALLDTAEASTDWSGGGRAIFVMDGHGNLYVSLEQKVGELHHSSLLAGADVAGAGELEVRGGKLVSMTDQSGHYVPKPKHNDRVLEELMKQGMKPHPDFKKFGFGMVERP